MKKIITRPAVVALAAAVSLLTSATLNSADTALGTHSIKDLVGDLQQVAAKKADPVLKSVAGDWSDKIVSLGKQFKDNPQVQAYLATAVDSVLGGHGPAAMAALQKLGNIEVTDKQLNLVKEVVNLGGAYLTQDNFAGLEGSESEVSQVVSALRKGDYMAAVTPLKQIAGNARLTDQQETLAKAMAETYVPGASQAKDLMKKIPGL